MNAAFLSDRGVIEISGDDARHFLDGLVTTDLDHVKPGVGRFGALLTPQGKIIADFFVTQAPAEHGSGLLLDCPRALAQPLADRLGFYKLRAKVSVKNISDEYGVLAIWNGEPSPIPDVSFADPRAAKLGWRVLMPEDVAEETAIAIGATLVDADAYEAHRIACGVPRGGIDFIYGDAFPHETNMDRLHGVDFDKGCYVGQEVVSRMQHRGTARTRIVRVTFDQSAPEAGVAITADDKNIGTMGSSANGLGLALMRTDRATEAMETGVALIAGGLPIRVASEDIAGAATKASA